GLARAKLTLSVARPHIGADDVDRVRAGGRPRHHADRSAQRIESALHLQKATTRAFEIALSGCERAAQLFFLSFGILAPAVLAAKLRRELAHARVGTLE